MSALTQDEIAKYWEIFTEQNPVNGKLSGEKMFTVLRNSQLDTTKLERIWDLADIDGDGSMDFEEFCIVMRLVFDQLKAPTQPVPDELPAWLVPADKQHLVDAKAALRGKPPSAARTSSFDDEDLSLSSDFNWYIGPEDRRKYESIYSVNTDNRGRISFGDLTELYQSLDGVPDTDVSSAWNIVNPRSDEKIDKEQCVVFLHILNQRSRGVRIPRSVPPSLRATFGKEMPSYDVSGSKAKIGSNWSNDDSFDEHKSKSFADGYMSKLGISSSSGSSQPESKDSEWEEVRLRRELADLDDRLSKIEKAKEAKQASGSSNSSLVRRELQLLLEYKEKQVQQSTADSKANGSGPDLKLAGDEVSLIFEQLDALKDHLARRQTQLQELEAELAQLA